MSEETTRAERDMEDLMINPNGRIPAIVDRDAGDFAVFDTQLKDNEYLAGDYSIADIANWSWMRIYRWSGVSVDGLEHLMRWHDAIAARPAAQRGVKVPKDTDALLAGTGPGADRAVDTARSIVQR